MSNFKTVKELVEKQGFKKTIEMLAVIAENKELNSTLKILMNAYGDLSNNLQVK